MSGKNIFLFFFFARCAIDFVLAETFENSVLLAKILGLSLITFLQNGTLPGH